ncbi:hypothetical protein ACO0LC_01505 [Undibacterium sp. JH2W]|uniref:hypothetical protein n=1 Tax=Undibacterium sp. JH2W TaxID=3413037 RepID=UPI003BF22BE9
MLQETLRYEYGAEGSRQFFEQCEIRLEYIRKEISNTNPDEHESLENNAALLNALSDLISRIERSSIGEYSWPFVDELKKIANAICTENTLIRAQAPPKIHVLSDGGLDKYAIAIEPKRPSGGTRRILTIVFPRSLKHYVLLHPVLGHELGHAIWQGSEHERSLQKIIEDKLLQTNQKFMNPDLAAAWMYSPQAPQGIKDELAAYHSKYGIDQTTFFQHVANWQAWVEEITCDLIGLATFGPSFVAALNQLLYGLMSSGVGFSPAHPPVGCRVNLMLSAIRLLGYDKMSVANQHHQKDIDDFWGQLHTQKQTNSWFDIFSDQELLDTLTEIRGLLSLHPPACYESPNPIQFDKLLQQLLNQIPPLDFNVNSDGTLSCVDVDFRHILYAGWVSSKKDSKTSFFDINRLCEHAIMQLGAIRTFKSP